MEDGIEVEKIINNFQDYFLTTMNKLCPVDSTKNKRDPSTLFNYSTASTVHPCSLDPNEFFSSDNGFTDIRSNVGLYQPAVNVVERHNCNGYCFRGKKEEKNHQTQILRWC